MVSRCPKYINKQLLATNLDLHMVPALYSVNIIYKDKALTNILQELRPDCLQKEGPGAKSLSRTALL